MIVLTAGPAALALLMQAEAIRERPSAQNQASSTASATASPPPMHRLATPFLPPRA